MNILIAPDSFKGSLSALEFCDIAAEVFQNHATHDIKLHLLPLADGGEGTIDAVLTYTHAQKIAVNVHNALGLSDIAYYAFLSHEHSDNPYGRDTAIIEMAQASGLPAIHPSQRNPLKTSSYGTGELIKHALNKGARKLIIGLGGSATNDGGMGMLSALGVQFYNQQGQSLMPAGQMLGLIERIDTTQLDPRLNECDIIIASDVNSPLLGEQGASRVFAAQKGADAEMIQQLESGMSKFAKKTLSTLSLPETTVNIPGVGAAGGMGFALLTYTQAIVQSGFDVLAEISALNKLLVDKDHKPDLIITGEGCFDQQSLQGKLTGRLISKAQTMDIPLMLLCGNFSQGIETRLNDNILLLALVNEQVSIDEAMQNTAQLVKHQLLKLIRTDIVRV